MKDYLTAKELEARSLTGRCIVCGEPLSLSPEKGGEWGLLHHNILDVVGVHNRHDKTLLKV